MFSLSKVSIFSVLLVSTHGLFSLPGDVYNDGKLLLTLYYEGKCGDSVAFILKQLVPTMLVLKDFVKLKFVPFGNAHSIDGGKSFVCQHGPSECLSNLIMDCALNYLRNTPDLVKLDYVACEMKTFAASQGSHLCTGYNPTVHTCANSQKGILLQRKSEHLTHLIKPNFIPFFTLNGVYEQKIQAAAMNDLLGVLCRKLGNIPPCIGLNFLRNNIMDGFLK